MKQGLDQVHSKALLEFLEKRQLHPIDALRVLSLSSLGILASYVEFNMTPDEKMQLATEIDKFSGHLKEVIQVSVADLFAILLSIQVLNRELVESASMELEEAKEALKNAEPNPLS